MRSDALTPNIGLIEHPSEQVARARDDHDDSQRCAQKQQNEFSGHGGTFRFGAPSLRLIPTVAKLFRLVRETTVAAAYVDAMTEAQRASRLQIGQHPMSCPMSRRSVDRSAELSRQVPPDTATPAAADTETSHGTSPFAEALCISGGCG